MKGKNVLCLAIVITMMFAAMPLMAVRANPTTIEIVFENGLHEIEYQPCDNFQVIVKVADAPEFTQYIIEISWDPNVLELQTGTADDVIQGPFMSGFGGTVFLVTDPEPGRLPEVTEALLAGYASGTGDLFYINFHAKGVGDSPITLERAVLLKELDVVPCDPVHGIVHVPPPPATPPNAEFTPETCTFVYVGDTVNLDATASTDGIDTLPETHTCPITSWTWEIDFGNDGTVDLELEGETASFTCTEAGDVAITLTVYAPDPNPPTSPDYRDTDSETHIIHQIVKPVGPSIDVYTERGGTGPGIDPATGQPYEYPTGWSDAYGPQEEVVVCAKVTYNDEPVEYKPVGFEIKDPTGQTIDYRTEYTDASGVACVTFRIPWEGSNAEDLFGNWTIVGTVDVAEETVMDICKFRFGYLVSIRDITVIGSPLHKGDSLGVDVDLKSICMSSKDVFLTIVLYDECGVPIGIATTVFTVDPEDGVASGFSIPIPTWAFVGTGTVYVNVFTAPPIDGGTPMCPEETAIFTIEKTP